MVKKIIENTIEIFSANWNVNGGKQSFVKLGNNNIFLQRGYNLFGIKNNTIHLLEIFDGFFDDWSETMQTYIKKIYDTQTSKYDYIIMVTHDDVTNKTTPRILQNYLIFLGCKKLKELLFRGSYLLIFDLKRNEILLEICENNYPIHSWLELVNNNGDYKLEDLGVPVYLIVYNLAYFAKRSVDQLKKYTRNIHIIDNRSTFPDLLKYYDNEYEFFLHTMENNYGHMVWLNELYWQFPKYFAISDPDLEFNTKLPHNFLNILQTLSNNYKKGKVGFALDISDSHLFFEHDNSTGYPPIDVWEKQFWIKTIEHPTYELYNAMIDTTFCMINKEFLNDLDGLRIAGNFTCKHTPWYDGWYKTIPEQEWEFYKKNNISSSTLKMISNMKTHNDNKSVTLFRDVENMINTMGKFIQKIDEQHILPDNCDIITKNINTCIDMLTHYNVTLSQYIINNKNNKI
jgi:hypothetical protein